MKSLAFENYGAADVTELSEAKGGVIDGLGLLTTVWHAINPANPIIHAPVYKGPGILL